MRNNYSKPIKFTRCISGDLQEPELQEIFHSAVSCEGVQVFFQEQFSLARRVPWFYTSVTQQQLYNIL